jgi:hypothetical protein
VGSRRHLPDGIERSLSGALVAKYLKSFKEFPPRAKAASFTVTDAMDKITTAGPNRN